MIRAKRHQGNATARRSFPYWRPLPADMHQGQHPHRFPLDLVYQSIVFMRDQLVGAGDYPRPAQLWVIGQRGSRITEKRIQPRGGLRVVGGDVVPHVGAVLLRLRRPENLHD